MLLSGRCLIQFRMMSHVTTPIFYPNAKPHLGHLFSSVICDVSHRWKLLQNEPNIFTTGTDEHGLKIQLASEKNGFTNCKQFVDRLCDEFIILDKSFNISFTRFIRTTDSDHIENVKKLWELCNGNGFIYQGEHKGWYSISDETFYPDSKVIKDPIIEGRYINTETNNEVVHHSEKNYFFKLSQFNDILIHYIESNPKFIRPEAKRLQILNELHNHRLQDLSISRPSFRVRWGIDVPGDPSQKVYVWFDALCNYLSSLGGIDAIINNAPVQLLHTTEKLIQNPRDWWENTRHIIGKDIIRFHTIYWPSFLMAAGLPLPKQVVVHGHWICNGMKMSKSLGNVVDPLLVKEHYGADPVRWFLLENSQLEEDGDFQEEKLLTLTNMFASKWGNLVNRCCSPKFNLQRAVQFYSDHRNPLFINNDILQTSANSLIRKLDHIPLLMGEAIEDFHTGSALRQVWSIINDANAFMQSSKPWAREVIEQDAVVFLCMEISRILSILCQPIIPDVATVLLDRINVPKENRTMAFAHIGADVMYGTGSNFKDRKVPIQRKTRRLWIN